MYDHVLPSSFGIFLIIIPQLYMVDLSFRPNLSPLERGGDKDFYTLEHYKHFLRTCEEVGIRVDLSLPLLGWIPNFGRFLMNIKI